VAATAAGSAVAPPPGVSAVVGVTSATVVVIGGALVAGLAAGSDVESVPGAAEQLAMIMASAAIEIVQVRIVPERRCWGRRDLSS